MDTAVVIFLEPKAPTGWTLPLLQGRSRATVQLLDRSGRLPSTPAQVIARLEGHDEWQMTDAERAVLADVMLKLKPQCAIEIGVYRAGSLAVVAAHSDKVYAVDIDPACEASYSSLFSNVQFITGRSTEIVPELIDRVQASGEAVQLILIDADHTEQGVRGDIESILAYQPPQPLYILMHDSFNPDCRRGIKNANWAANEHVHLVELDFVAGRLEKTNAKGYGEMWCGLGLAILLPETRKGALTIHENERLLFEASLRKSAHSIRYWQNPAVLLSKLLRGARRHIVSPAGARKGKE
jgi:methyltransferase family protein